MPEAKGTINLVDLCEASVQVREAMRDLRNNDEVRHFMISQGEISPEEHSRWLKSLEGNRKSKVFAALFQDKLVGQANLTQIDGDNGHAEWGFFVDPKMRRHGLGRQMLCALLDFVFNDFGLQKINAGVLSHNEASLALHKRFGFVEEGRRRRHAFQDGAWRDLVLYGMTREEWHAAKPSLQGKEA